MIRENKSNPAEFACVKSDNTINYFRLTENEVFLLNSFKEHTGKINDICFFDKSQYPFENCFITASSDSTIKIWDIRSKVSATTLKSN
jgi:WD40 repeat protein